MYNYYSRVKARILTRLTQLPVNVDTLYTVQGTVHCTKLHKDILAITKTFCISSAFVGVTGSPYQPIRTRYYPWRFEFEFTTVT